MTAEQWVTTDPDREAIRQRCLARLELACDQTRELETIVVMAVRGARSSGATWEEIRGASGMGLSALRRIAK